MHVEVVFIFLPNSLTKWKNFLAEVLGAELFVISVVGKPFAGTYLGPHQTFCC